MAEKYVLVLLSLPENAVKTSKKASRLWKINVKDDQLYKNSIKLKVASFDHKLTFLQNVTFKFNNKYIIFNIVKSWLTQWALHKDSVTMGDECLSYFMQLIISTEWQGSYELNRKITNKTDYHKIQNKSFF